MNRFENLDDAMHRSEAGGDERQSEDWRWSRFDDVPPAGGEARGKAQAETRKPIKASPFRWRDPASIPLRPWLYGTVYCREIITVTAGPGGYGKSSLALVEAVAMASGRSLLGIQVTEPRRVWYVNLEDDRDELDRRIMAICLHFGITEEDLSGRLFIDSASECEGMIFVTETSEGVRVAEPVVSDVVAEMEANSIDLLTVDPFVSAHEVDENSNTRINIVKNTFAGIARRTSAAVGLVHHVRKGASAGGSYSVEDSRGAKALVDGARVARVLNGMSVQEGESYGVENPRTFFYMTTGKANFAPASERREWYRIVSVSLGNGAPSPGFSGHLDLSDHIGVVTTWEPPDPMKDTTVAHLRGVQAAVRAGTWRQNHQAADWVGIPVARVLGCDLNKPSDKKRVMGNIKVWLKSGALVVVDGKDAKGRSRPLIEVGQAATDN